MAPPLISVVMPCFNAERFVEEAVRSALEQTYRSVELVVVDDGSTDSSLRILTRLEAQFRGRLRLLSGARQGPYPARNKGLREARGELIAFLDADDYWEPDFLQSMLDALQGKRVDIAYCGWQNVGDGAPGRQPYVPPAYEDEDPVEHFLRGCPWPIHAALIRRQVISAAGGFSERMFSSMDYDLWIRLLTVTRKMVRVPRVLSYYRWHGSGQISAVKSRQVLHAWQVRRDFVAGNPGLVAHLPSNKRRELIDAVLLEQGKILFWRRDLSGAQTLLRKALRTGAWGLRDLPLLSAAHLPPSLFQRIVHYADRGTSK
jgi:glycosyltransferase involved in cell wall biosynthesis